MSLSGAMLTSGYLYPSGSWDRVLCIYVQIVPVKESMWPGPQFIIHVHVLPRTQNTCHICPSFTPTMCGAEVLN